MQFKYEKKVRDFTILEQKMEQILQKNDQNTDAKLLHFFLIWGIS